METENISLLAQLVFVCGRRLACTHLFASKIHVGYVAAYIRGVKSEPFWKYQIVAIIVTTWMGIDI